MDFDKQLVKWNGGVERGAARKFAAEAEVGEAYVSELRNGKRDGPGEELLPRFAKVFGISVADVRALFPRYRLSEAAGVTAVADRVGRDPGQEIAELRRLVARLAETVDVLSKEVQALKDAGGKEYIKDRSRIRKLGASSSSEPRSRQRR